MIADSTIAIIGLGLMGGSVARAAAARGARVLGHDRNVEHLEHALRDRAVHAALDRDLEGLEHADIVVLALPVDATCAALPAVAQRATKARLVMDLASTKRSVVSCAESAGVGARFVGAHPMAGSHRSGWSAGRASLFDSARVYLCPTRSTTEGVLREAEQFWRELHAHTEALDPCTHDEELAWISHLPHIMSSALAVTLADAGIARSALGPGGRDVTRLAGSSTAMWSAIAADNAEAIVRALTTYEAQLRRFREAIATRDTAETRALLEAGREWFDGSASIERPRAAG